MIDSVFVIGDDRSVIYCNEAAATLCESSVRRITKGRTLADLLKFSESNLFISGEGDLGKNEPYPLTELNFKVVGSGKDGKGQIAIHPFTEPDGSPRWIVLIRDVTLEEVLHAKYHKQLEEKQVFIEQLQSAQKQLESYSKNLEQMVEERTHEVRRANVMLNAIMDSLGQGFLVFDENGDCSQFFTKACLQILEKSPEGKKIWDVLSLSVADGETFKLWMKAVFSQSLAFDSLKDLAPQAYAHSEERHVKLDYFPILDSAQKVTNVVLVATDWTSEFLANQALEKEKKYAKMVVKLVSSQLQFGQFLKSAQQAIAEVTKAAETQPTSFDVGWAFRVLHTLEGEAAIYSAEKIWSASREPQEVLEPLKKTNAHDLGSYQTSFVEKMGHLQAAYQSFLEENHKLFELLGIGGEPKISLTKKDVQAVLQFLADKGVDPVIQTFVAKLIMDQPVAMLFSHYADLAETVAEKLNKSVAPVVWQNADLRTDLDRFKNLAASFVHAFRNAVDHGIEAPEDREMMGKPRAGQLVFSCERFNRNGHSWLRFQLTDDGQGIDVERLRKKLDLPQDLSDEDVMQKVFDSGVSSRDSVSEFSGRGIGLNAVKDEAEALGGTAFVKKGESCGTRLIVEVPELQPAETILKSA